MFSFVMSTFQNAKKTLSTRKTYGSIDAVKLTFQSLREYSVSTRRRTLQLYLTMSTFSIKMDHHFVKQILSEGLN